MSADTQGRATVIVVSTSAAAGAATDETGPVLREWLEQRGFRVDAPRIVPDGEGAVGTALRDALAREPRIIITTGGTGIAEDDRTPEAVVPFLDVELPGILEALRAVGRSATPHAALTRGVAGFAGSSFVITLPGSQGGVSDGLTVLDGVLDHLLDQRATGAGHEPRGSVGQEAHR